MTLIDLIRNYKFKVSGEVIRAAEIFVLTAAVEVIGPISSIHDIKTYAVAAVLAGLNALVGFIKGQLPPAAA